MNDCRELARSRGWPVGQEYVDNDVSAFSDKPRPAYRQMLDDLRSVAVSAYTMRSDVPQTVWRELFHDATESIDILVYCGTFLFDAVAKFSKALTHAAKINDVRVRILIGDPACRAVKVRGIEEAIVGSLADRCEMTLKRFRDIDPANIDIRLHDSTLYMSMFRADDTLIANHHLYGSPASDNPCFVIEGDQHPDLWTSYHDAFERVWKRGTPT